MIKNKSENNVNTGATDSLKIEKLRELYKDNPSRQYLSPSSYAGIDAFESDPLTRRPDCGLKSAIEQPDWLTHDAWIKHRNWCGDFFGWTNEPAYMIGNRLILGNYAFNMIKGTGLGVDCITD
jgi:hypothetical protein